ncbi:MAG TPA: hypothetical protein VGS19_37625 [Streptosporangiaceae bacterium]|nr:hypothetical protein [Streptosporangiaceae bacterium]
MEALVQALGTPSRVSGYLALLYVAGSLRAAQRVPQTDFTL